MSEIKQKNDKTSPRPNVVRTKAKAKINPVSGANFEFTPDRRLNESFVIVVGDTASGRSITFHHPIGTTNLDDDDWVATPTEDVTSLLQRQKDPGEAARKANRDKFRIRLAIEGNLLTREETDEERLLYYGTDISRQDTVVAARAATKSSYKEGEKPSPDSYIRFIEDKDLREKESILRKFLSEKSTISKAEKAFPNSKFQTQGGPLADRRQKAVDYLDGLDRPQAIDRVTKRVYGFQ
jgi:hypothetical protein